MARDVLDALSDTATLTNKSNAAITLTVDAGPMSQEMRDELGINQEQTARTFLLPAQAGLQAYITNKALTTNVATITTSPAHGFVTGQQVLIDLDTADSVFEGYQIVSTAPTATTFTFAKTNADVASAASAGYVRAAVNIGDKITFESVPYEVRKITVPDGIWAVYSLECVRVQAQRLGAA